MRATKQTSTDHLAQIRLATITLRLQQCNRIQIPLK
jgi:hypothetical protein